jgi:RNA polymerase sigma factor (sigma-70 family)
VGDSTAHIDALVGSAASVDAESRAADAAFEQLYVVTFPKAYAFLRCQVATTETAQDLVSRVFLKAYQHRFKAPGVDDGGVHWIFRIAHTTLIDYWRVDKRREIASLSLDELIVAPASGHDPEDEYRCKQRTAHLVQAISELPDDDRIVLGLKFAAQRMNREIAIILGISEGAVSMRLLRALRRLRERLNGLGWG